MMNVVTAFFVESAFKAAQEEEKNHTIRHLAKLFSPDGYKTGGCVITKKEFDAHWSSPEMQQFLENLGVDPTQEQEDFFYLLDSSGDGTIDADELLAGCVRLKGNAKAVDLAAFARET